MDQKRTELPYSVGTDTVCKTVRDVSLCHHCVRIPSDYHRAPLPCGTVFALCHCVLLVLFKEKPDSVCSVRYSGTGTGGVRKRGGACRGDERTG